jgi:hypothetical protein
MPPESAAPVAAGGGSSGAHYSPEKWDIYSSGLILYYLWTKREPFHEVSLGSDPPAFTTSYGGPSSSYRIYRCVEI